MNKDLGAASGKVPVGSFPIVLGHEGAGIVRQTGSKVDGFGEGDYVILTSCSCHSCKSCSAGRIGSCVRGAEMNFIGPRGMDDADAVFQTTDGKPIRGQFSVSRPSASSASWTRDLWCGTLVVLRACRY
jgi:Zn-dependent alcohol dehydrogenase